MIYIITGPVNSGKSSKLILEYKRLESGDGFYNRKIYDNNEYIGQELVRFTSGESVPFSYRINSIPKDWDELYRFRDYSFSKSGLSFAENVCNEVIGNNANPLFIDEVGPLELKHMGLYNILILILNTNKDIFLVVREWCLKDVLLAFNITNYEII